MIDWLTVQGRLGVKQDGQAGPVTYTALMVLVAGTKSAIVGDLARALSLNAAPLLDAPLLDAPPRLAGFLGQTCHESMNFTRLKEIGGASYFKTMYDIQGARPDKARSLGNFVPGDGARYFGRGLLQVTGKANYAACGKALAIDLVGTPELAEAPDIAVLTALWYWQRCRLNTFCDATNWPGLTAAISGSATQHFAERSLYTNRALQVLS